MTGDKSDDLDKLPDRSDPRLVKSDEGDSKDRSLSSSEDSAICITAEQIAIYDSVLSSSHDEDRRPHVSMTVSIVLVAIALITSIVIAASSSYLLARTSTISLITIAGIAVAVMTAAWFIWALIKGTGRRYATISPILHASVVIPGLYGMVAGYGLYSAFGASFQPLIIAIGLAGLIGVAISIVILIRDLDIADHRLDDPSYGYRERVSRPLIHTVEIDLNSHHGDELVSRGCGPLPRRGTLADATLWDDPADDEPTQVIKPRRAL